MRGGFVGDASRLGFDGLVGGVWLSWMVGLMGEGELGLLIDIRMFGKREFTIVV